MANNTRSSFQNSTHFAPSLGSLADPPVNYVDGAAMDYFSIEIINTLHTSSAVAAARAKQLEQEMTEAGLIPAPAHSLPPLNIVKDSARDSLASSISQASSSKKASAEDDDEATRVRLESIGMHVGANLAER